MQWGGSEGFFKQVYEGEGRHHPARLRKPALRGDCVCYYDAYRYLGAKRIWTQVGPTPLQPEQVLSYLKDALGIQGYEERQKYLRLIDLLDRVELKHIASKRK